MRWIVDESIGNFQPWSGAVSTYERIRDEGKLDEFEELLKEIYTDELPTETEINDLLWFDDAFVFERLGIKEDD